MPKQRRSGNSKCESLETAKRRIRKRMNFLATKYEALSEIELANQEDREQLEEECEKSFQRSWVGWGSESGLVYKDCNAAHLAELKEKSK